MPQETQDENATTWRGARALKKRPTAEQARVFEAVLAAYMEGPTLAEIARSIGMGHRTLHRFMNTFDRKAWLDAQEIKQWVRIERSRDAGVFWDRRLYGSAGYRMDKIEAHRKR